MPPRGRPVSHDKQKVAEMRAAGMKWSEISRELGVTERTAMRAMPSQRQAAIDLAIRFGTIEEEHHKAWVIDQMVRILAGKDYDELVQEVTAAGRKWDVGIAP